MQIPHGFLKVNLHFLQQSINCILTNARAKGTHGSFIIYLPKEYQQTNKKYPVIYYLHVGNGNQNQAESLMKKIDKAIEAGTMSPVIVVGVQALPIGWYCNANVGGFVKGVISGPQLKMF